MATTKVRTGWVAAHGVMIVTPVNCYQAPTGLKAMIIAGKTTPVWNSLQMTMQPRT